MTRRIQHVRDKTVIEKVRGRYQYWPEDVWSKINETIEQLPSKEGTMVFWLEGNLYAAAKAFGLEFPKRCDQGALVDPDMWYTWGVCRWPKHRLSEVGRAH